MQNAPFQKELPNNYENKYPEDYNCVYPLKNKA